MKYKILKKIIEKDIFNVIEENNIFLIKLFILLDKNIVNDKNIGSYTPLQ